MCPADYKPVCASDGITYSNNCTLEIENYCKGRDIKFVSNGQCPGMYLMLNVEKILCSKNKNIKRYLIIKCVKILSFSNLDMI